jgi:cytochrome c oxidase subunit II
MQGTASRSRARSLLRTSLGVGAPLLVIGLLLGGCLIPPQPRTDAGRDVFNLYLIVFALAVLVFAGVEGFILYAVFRYRRRPGDDVLPVQYHGNALVEIIWTAIPTVIVLILFVTSTLTLATVEARSEDPGVTINVESFQWQWRFHYPEAEVSVTGTPNEPATMAIPVGEPVRLNMSSADVIHAFYAPDFLIKRDIIPVPEGEEGNNLEFTVTEPGTYAGQCAEFCGTAHADMVFTIEAMPRAEFDQWLSALAAGETPQPQAGEECDTTVSIKANNTLFDIDEFEVPADTPFCIEFENQENIPHNVSIYEGGEALFQGEFLNTAGIITYEVPALPQGEFRFICDAHPQAMVGDVIVTP